MATVTDSATGITTSYYYDLTDRLMHYSENGGGRSHSVRYVYDAINNLTSVAEEISGTSRYTGYTYDDDNRVSSVSSGTTNWQYHYDVFGRMYEAETKKNDADVLTETYAYNTPYGTGGTNHFIDSKRLQATGYDVTYSYTYDDNGNILSVSDGYFTTTYVYDTANQLIRENNQAGNFTHTWEYDSAGNILNRKEYAYTTGELGTPLDSADSL